MSEKTHFLLQKLLALLGVSALFLVMYFGALAVNAERLQEALPWDPVHELPVYPPFTWIYISLYVMPVVTALLIKDRRTFWRFTTANVVAIVVSVIVFLIMPLVIRRPHLPGTDYDTTILRWIYQYDEPSNLFPSLHVSIGFLCGFAVTSTRPKLAIPFIAWAVLIAISTLLTRQHYMLDVAGGVVVSMIAWWSSKKLVRSYALR